MKTCPYCAEEIQDAAIKCRFCGEMLGGAPEPATPPAKKETNRATRGCLLVLATVGLMAILSVLPSGSPKSSGQGKQATAGSGHLLKSETFGDEWPFPDLEAARLDCKVLKTGDARRPLVIVKLGSTRYGLNDAAMGAGSYPDARTKMARRPEWGTYELGASSKLIGCGISICGL